MQIYLEDEIQMENRQMDKPDVSEIIEKPIAADPYVSVYGEYKVVNTFSDSGLTLTDALESYIERVTSLKY